jgi:hypothetical protein
LTALIGIQLGLRDDTLPMMFLELAIAGLLCLPLWIWGREWNSQTRQLLDLETGEQLVLAQRHSAFGIPLQYWAIVWPGVVLAILIARAFEFVK